MVIGGTGDSLKHLKTIYQATPWYTCHRQSWCYVSFLKPTIGYHHYSLFPARALPHAEKTVHSSYNNFQETRAFGSWRKITVVWEDNEYNVLYLLGRLLKRLKEKLTKTWPTICQYANMCVEVCDTPPLEARLWKLSV